MGDMEDIMTERDFLELKEESEIGRRRLAEFQANKAKESPASEPSIAPEKSPPEVDHARHSMLRERIVEHRFIGEALRLCWIHGVTDVEVLRSESDAFGYDLVMERGGIVRHIQLKTVLVGGKNDEVKVSLKLAEKPGGCVIWIFLGADLSFDHFLWFGGAPGTPLPDLHGFKVAKHTKGNADGKKAERPAHRLVCRAQFAKLISLDDVLVHLFGPLVQTPEYPS
jgi:hypothetical protein